MSIVSPAGQCYAMLSQCRASKLSGNTEVNASMHHWQGRAQYQHEWVQMRHTGWSLGSRLVIRDMSAHSRWQWYICATSGWKRVISRDDHVLYHIMWLQYGICRHTGSSTVLWVWKYLHNNSSLSFKTCILSHQFPLSRNHEASGCKGHVNAITGNLSNKM